MRRISIFLWVALGGAVLQLIALGSNFYVVGDNRRDAWLGVPHTSDLILASAVVTVVMLILVGIDRSPVRGRNVGLIVGAVGVLATAQLVYRMVIPPFGCLQYSCSGSDAADVTLLAGIWIGLAGCVMAAAGGLLHSLTRTAREAPARPFVASRQAGMSPWLGIAALGAVGQFVFGFVGFNFYTVSGFAGQEGTTTWGGWLSIPHTSSLVLLMSAGAVFLVVAAARNRSPLSPSAAGAVIGVLGFVAGARLLFRILESPFSSAGGSTTQVGAVEVGIAPFLALASALAVVVAGAVHAAQHREERAPAPQRAGEPAQGAA